MVVMISDMDDSSTTNVELFFDVGFPAGRDILKAGFTLEPKFISIEPNVGTPAGTYIKAKVSGVGTKTWGLDLKDSTGESICEDVAEVTEYGIVRCHTKYGDIAAG